MITYWIAQERAHNQQEANNFIHLFKKKTLHGTSWWLRGKESNGSSMLSYVKQLKTLESIKIRLICNI